MKIAIIIMGLVILILVGKLSYDWFYWGNDARCYSKDCVDYAD